MAAIMNFTYDSVPKKTQALFNNGAVFSIGNFWCRIHTPVGGVVSQQITTQSGSRNVTLFSFDKGQGIIEHTASFDAMVQISME